MAPRPTNFEDYERESSFAIPEPDPQLLAQYDYQEWKDLNEDELVNAIKKAGGDGLYNAIKRGLMLWHLKANDLVVLDEKYCDFHDLGKIDSSTADKLMNLARSPRTHIDWGDRRPKSWRTMHELVKFNPRSKERSDGPEIGKYAVSSAVFETVRAIITPYTIRREVTDYINGCRLSSSKLHISNLPVILPAKFRNQVFCMRAEDMISQLPDNSIGAMITSPMYPGDREYPSESEFGFPDWFAKEIMEKLYPKMQINGNVIVVLDAQIHDGDQSDYIKRTEAAVLALPCRWHNPQDLIWDKVHATPSGSRYRLRKRFVRVLWFSRTPAPYINTTACGKFSERLGAQVGNQDVRYNGSNGFRSGIARITDMFEADATQTDKYTFKDVRHRAMFPLELVRQFLLTFAPPKSLVCDLFAGAGTTLLGARKYGHSFVGCDCVQEFVDMINHRLLHDKRYSAKGAEAYQVASEM